MATEVLAESYVMATGYAAIMGAPTERQHLFARSYDQPVTVAKLAEDWKQFNRDQPGTAWGTRVVIARTVEQARTIAKGLAQSGAVALSPRSIIKDGGGRGLIISEVLVDESVWPLDNEVLENIMPACQSAIWWIRRATTIGTREWSRAELRPK